MVASVNTKQDLRILKPDALIEASSIEITRVANLIDGIVTQVSGNTLTIKAIPPKLPENVPAPLDQQAERAYTVTVTAETEISRKSAGTPSVPQKIALSQLTTDMPISIYSLEDTAFNTNLSALRIEPR